MTEPSDDNDAQAELNLKLREFYARGTVPTLVILPSQLRDGTWFYSEADVESAKTAQAVGVDAKFLDSANDRRYVAEYSADIAIELAFAVMTNISADAIIAIGRYVIAQLGSLADNGLISGRSSPKVLVRAKRIDVSDGHFVAEDLEIIATGDTVAAEIARLLSGKRVNIDPSSAPPSPDGDIGRKRADQ